MGFEDDLSRTVFSQNSEKTYIDKILARGEVDRVKELVSKNKLSRSEILELLYMCLGTESKLVNLSTWDRYIVLKFFVWIREFIKIAEIMHDYTDDLTEKEKKKEITISKRTKAILANNERLIEHNAKFLIDLYFNILRTTLSIGGTGFLEILKNKYEINYPQANVQTPMNENSSSGNMKFWNRGNRNA